MARNEREWDIYAQVVAIHYSVLFASDKISRNSAVKETLSPHNLKQFMVDAATRAPKAAFLRQGSSSPFRKLVAAVTYVKTISLSARASSQKFFEDRFCETTEQSDRLSHLASVVNLIGIGLSHFAQSLCNLYVEC